MRRTWCGLPNSWDFCFVARRAVMPFTFARADQVRVVIPMHKGELKRKTLRGIIQDLKISVEEFGTLLQSGEASAAQG